MMKQQKVMPIPRFEAEDAKGRQYSIVGTETVASDGGDAWRRISISLKTIDGLKVKYLAQGVYEVEGAQTVRVTSDDPHAP